MDKDTVYSSLGELLPEFRVFTYKSIPSTNAKAKWLQTGFPSGNLLVVAESQTEGRGRGEHTFFSPDGGIYMTIAANIPEYPRLLTVSAAVAVCLTLKKFGVDTRIKWVNDLFTDKGKVCGILCESGGYNRYICGIGINTANVQFPKDIENIAAAVELRDKRAEIVCEVARAFLDIITNWSEEKILSSYYENMLIVGKNIAYTVNGVRNTGTVLGINGDAHLLVRQQNGDISALSSGEIELI